MNTAAHPIASATASLPACHEVEHAAAWSRGLTQRMDVVCLAVRRGENTMPARSGIPALADAGRGPAVDDRAVPAR